jgi:hypothetical protein
MALRAVGRSFLAERRPAAPFDRRMDRFHQKERFMSRWRTGAPSAISRFRSASLDHLIGAYQQGRRNLELKDPCGLEVNNQLELGVRPVDFSSRQAQPDRDRKPGSGRANRLPETGFRSKS